VIGQPLSSVANLGVLQERLRQVVAERERFQENIFSFETADGPHWGEWRVGPVKDRNGRVTHWLAILRDITERKRLEKEILEISDREQRRIGQDLHDGLCQHLAGIELMSQVLERKVAARSKSDAARVGEIGRLVRESIGQTRLLARGLSPVTLESEGLMSALQELALNTEKMFHVTCVVKCDPPVLIHDHAAATHLYRIAQEAVSNAVKHGKAKNITISLKKIGDRNVLMVKDNGVGLPKARPNGKGMGLRIMQYRAGMIGGEAMVERDLNGGTTVICSVPRTLAKREREKDEVKKK
jgi:signal transduction histidine kinase